MTTNHSTRRLLVAAVLAGAGLAIAACDGGGGAAQQTRTETVTVPAEDQTGVAAAEDPAAGDPADSAGAELPAGWPDDNFPVPPGVTVTKREGPDGLGMLLVGKSPDEVTSFYRSALPAAGYKITNDSSVGAGGVQVTGMEFTGNGFSGELAVVNSTVSISLHEG